jgi:hypothetical protein
MNSERKVRILARLAITFAVIAVVGQLLVLFGELGRGH